MNKGKKYVTMKKFGSWQLGNQMFQYLFLNYISKITQRKIIFFYENNEELENYKKLIKLNTYFNLDYIYVKYYHQNVISTNDFLPLKLSLQLLLLKKKTNFQLIELNK